MDRRQSIQINGQCVVAIQCRDQPINNGLDAKGTAAYQVTRLTSSFSKPLSGTADINDQDDHYYLTAHEQNKQVKC
jgi:hypothetical protein